MSNVEEPTLQMVSATVGVRLSITIQRVVTGVPGAPTTCAVNVVRPGTAIPAVSGVIRSTLKTTGGGGVTVNETARPSELSGCQSLNPVGALVGRSVTFTKPATSPVTEFPVRDAEVLGKNGRHRGV